MQKKYKIVLVKNFKILKVFKAYAYGKCAYAKFNKIKEENQVFYNKKYVNEGDTLKKTTYEVLLLEKVEKKDKIQRKVFNNINQIVEETVIGDWNILTKFEYFFEETFKVYGLKKRLTVPEILNDVILKIVEEVHYFVVVINYLVIYNDNSIEVILCKNVFDAKRLYDFLFNFLREHNMLNLIFLGVAGQSERYKLYDRIEKHAGVNRREIYRNSTRS